MSYDIELRDPVTKEVLCAEVPHRMEGGTYCMNGTTELWLNITYNYADWYYHDGTFAEKKEDSEGIRTIYNMTGAESIPVLKKAISFLENLDEDISEERKKKCIEQGVTGYWMPTRENAIKPLYQLLAMAQMRPDGIWYGD